MPIPQLKSNFSKRKINNIHQQFSHRPIAKISKPKKKKLSGRFLYKKRPKMPRIPKLGGSGGWFKGLIRRLWPYMLGLVFLGGIFMIGLFAWYSRDLPEPGQIMDRSVALSTKIYDRTGEVLLYEIHGPENRTLVKIADIPEHVVNATIAIEDKNFYQHSGFDPLGWVRAGFNTVFRLRRLGGGSTLTQQLVKNVLLTNQRSVSRKVKEFVLSVQIEKKYSKDEILQMYLNESPYGGTAWGVQAASETYFGKDVDELNLIESAVLAGLPQSPSRYSPFIGGDTYIGRTKDVLRRMREDDYITKDQEKQALEDLDKIEFAPEGSSFKAPHFYCFITTA